MNAFDQYNRQYNIGEASYVKEAFKDAKLGKKQLEMERLNRVGAVRHDSDSVDPFSQALANGPQDQTGADVRQQLTIRRMAIC